MENASANNIFFKCLLNDKVKIEPIHLGKGVRDHVARKLKTSIEGMCSKHGYVKQGSIEIHKMLPGNVDLIGLNGYITFDVYFFADVCNPLIGNIVRATVVNVNKFGILADSTGILEIIVPKNSVNIVHDAHVDIEKINIGDVVNVEIVGKKYELYDKKISIVGRIVLDWGEGTVSSKSKGKKQTVPEQERAGDDEDDINDDIMQGGVGVLEDVVDGTDDELTSDVSEDEESEEEEGSSSDEDEENFFESEEEEGDNDSEAKTDDDNDQDDADDFYPSDNPDNEDD